MVRPKVHTTKHYVQNSLATITASTKSDTIIAETTNVTAANAVQEVREGCDIKAVYIEDWLRSGEVSGGSVICCLYKNTGGSTVFSTTDLAAMGAAENKKNVFFFSQGLINDNNADAIPFVRRYFKIPKGKQRFGLGDRLIWTVFAQGAIDVHRCGFMTYKEYY